MKLLIVEDEPLFLYNLVYQIDWDQYGIEVMSAENGQEALQRIGRNLPDIVLLDIQMPEMDGLALARVIQERYSQIKVIILSGHDNFAYAQQAIKLGIVKYLLKPAEDEEIVEAVLEAVRLVKEEWERNHSHMALQQKWTEHLPRLQAGFFQNLINGRYADWEISRRSRDLMLDLSEKQQNTAIVVQMDPLSKEEERFTQQDHGLLQFSLHCMAKELFSGENCEIITDSNGDTVLLFMGASDNEQEWMARMNSFASKLISVVKECLKLTASAGIGTCVKLEHLPLSYQQALRALEDRVIFGHDLVISYRERTSVNENSISDAGFTKAIEVALLTGDQERAVALSQDFVRENIEGSNTLQEVKEFLLWMSGLLTRIVQSQNWSVKQVVGDDYAYFLNLNALLSKEQMLEWLSRTVKSITSYARTQRSSQHEHLLKQILSFVDERMEHDLTLNAVADSMYINSSYLSRLFKQEMGKTFSDYVLERKMTKARELLLDGRKVHDTAVMTGYKEDSYFIKVFRKYWGVTPGEIRVTP